MRKEVRTKIEIGKYHVHYRKAPRGWAIIVMPNQFKVDNYYHDVHVHPDRKVLPIKDPDIIFNIICLHLEREKLLIESKLRKELGL
jgi:hypothetical protein